MKRPGLTPAMRTTLELIRAGKLIDAGSAYQAINKGFADDGWAGPYLTPRGHAALAAEPMTVKDITPEVSRTAKRRRLE